MAADPSVNQALAELAVNNNILMDGVINDLDYTNQRILTRSGRDIEKLIPKNLSQMSRESFLELSKEVDANRRIAFKALSSETKAVSLDVAKIDSEFVANNINSELSGLPTNKARPLSNRDIATIYRVKPFGNQIRSSSRLAGSNQTGTMSDWLGGISRNDRRAMTTILKNGYLNGSSKTSMVNAIRQRTNLSIRDAKTVSRTGTNYLVNQTRLDTFKANSDIVKQVQWVSILDDRVSEICSDRHGDTYELNTTFIPPAHFNCRSTIVPVVKSWREMDLDERNVPKGLRSRNNGSRATLKSVNYLRSLSRKTLDRLFGVEKSGAFLSGRLAARDLVTSAGVRRTIPQLKRDGKILRDEVNAFERNTELPVLYFADSAAELFATAEGRRSLKDLIEFKADGKGSFTWFRDSSVPDRATVSGQYAQSYYDPILKQYVTRTSRPYVSDYLTEQQNKITALLKSGQITQEIHDNIYKTFRSLNLNDGFQDVGALSTLRLLATRDLNDFPDARALSNYVGSGLDSFARPKGELSAIIGRYAKKNPRLARVDSKDIDLGNYDADKVERDFDLSLEDDLMLDFETNPSGANLLGDKTTTVDRDILIVRSVDEPDIPSRTQREIDDLIDGCDVDDL